MVPLMACSVLSLAVVLDRLWNLRRGKVISPEVIIQVNHWVGQGVVEEAIALCRRVKNPMTNVVMAALLSDPRHGPKSEWPLRMPAGRRPRISRRI